MTRRSEVERALDRYLADGEEQVPDRVIDAALDEIEHTSQRRASGGPWRSFRMPAFVKPLLAAAAVVAILVVGGAYLVGGSLSNLGGEPPTASHAPSARPLTSLP